jgi:hypothetical protein
MEVVFNILEKNVEKYSNEEVKIWMLYYLWTCISRKIYISTIYLRGFLLNYYFELLALGLTQPLTEMSTRNNSWAVKAAGARADNLTAFMYRLSWNMGASTSWNSRRLSRPGIGSLYLYLHLYIIYIISILKYKICWFRESFVYLIVSCGTSSIGKIWRVLLLFGWECGLGVGGYAVVS